MRPSLSVHRTSCRAFQCLCSDESQ
uniref:Uncharacterized protein n=1 Tax=Toxoplasma gondii (strain ATCC 50861 / VEG) TaxID=432359 RepID=A0A0F7URX2_TOXGV|nr:TPA: hypothetical protein BN1205_038645 [Toxoplasma gondii VEG]